MEEQLSGRGVEFASSLQLGDTLLSMDPGLMRRALINIFDNACHALQVEGKGEYINNARLHVKSHIGLSRVEITVSDNGAGISESELPHVFEPLFSTKSFGLGLGMSIVHQIMKQHGGNVEVQSEVGKGTNITLWLPLSLIL